MHAMGPEPTAALVNEVGAEPIGQLVVAMGPDLAAAVVHEMGVDLTADLVAALGVGTASGIVQSAGGSETGALVRALGAEFTAQLVTKMGVTQNVALVAALGPGVLATLVAAMGPAFIASLSLSMSSEIFQAIFGGGGAGVLGNNGGGESSADRPVSPSDTYTPASRLAGNNGSSGLGGFSSSGVEGVAGAGGVRTTPVTVAPSQRVVIPTVTITDSTTGGSKLMSHLADGTRLPVAAPSSSSTTMTGVAVSATRTVEPGSHPIATAGTADTAISIDSTVGIPAVPAAAAAPAGPDNVAVVPMGRVIGHKEGLPVGQVGTIKAVPLTHNAEQVMANVERQIRDQGGRIQ